MLSGAGEQWCIFFDIRSRELRPNIVLSVYDHGSRGFFSASNERKRKKLREKRATSTIYGDTDGGFFIFLITDP